MRKLLVGISTRISGFIAQREDVALVLAAAEADALPLLSILEGIEAEQASDFFWTFTDAFTDAISYVEAVEASFASKFNAVRMLMQKEGMAPWPPLPALFGSTSAAPAARLRELAKFSRRLLPVPNGGTVVWTFFPLQIQDPLAYADLMRELTAHRFPLPWCHHLRFILRDDPVTPALVPRLASAARIRHLAPDLSVEALNHSIEQEAADETLPLAQRMSSLLVSAGNDLAFERFPGALEKYALLFRYHGAMNSYALAAVAMSGMGQVYERMGELAKAGEAYQAALVPAGQGSHPSIQVLLNVVLNLANLRMKEQRWEEGEGYWDVVQQLATLSRDGPLKVRALLQRGLCQAHQAKAVETEQSWLTGAVIAAQMQEADLCRELLEHLRRLYAVQRQDDRARALAPYLDALGPCAEDHRHEHG